MCGIFGVVGEQRDAPQKTLMGLKTLEYRGYDSWGVAWGEQKLQHIKQVGKIGDAQLPDTAHSPIAIGHTRWATHGGVTVENAHPHLDCTGKLAVVHNGIVENYAQLQRQLQKSGHTFASETDTEVIVHLIEEHLNTLPFVTAVQQTFLQLEGLNAIVCLDIASQTVIVAKNGSPVVLAKTPDATYVASDAVALLPYSREVVFLEDAQMAVATKDALQIFQSHTLQAIPTAFTTLEYEIEAAEKGQYPHFMLKEIQECPEVIARVMNKTTEITQFKRGLEFPAALVGCGSAGYAALFGSYLFNQSGALTFAYAGSEFRHVQKVDALRSVVFISQSGETIDLVEPAKALKKQGKKVAAIVNRIGSTLERMADGKILLSAGPEISVVATKSLIAKLATLLALTASDQHAIARQLQQARLEVQRLVDQQMEKNLDPVITVLQQHNNVFVIGRGVLYPIVLEVALKLKEATYAHAEGFAAGELKHGVIALIEKGTPCIVLAQDDDEFAEVISSAQELKARGALIIGISTRESEVFDHWQEVKDCGTATALPLTVVTHLLAYRLAVSKGLDPDKPRNLAKSVTVK